MSLLKNVLDLNRLLARADISSWPQEDREGLRDHARLLKKRDSGPLRLLRNERSAHQDPDKFMDAQARARAHIPSTEVLKTLCETLFVLTLRLNHYEAYAWSRYPDPSRPDLVEIHQAGNIGPVRFLTDGDSLTRWVGRGFGCPGLLAAKKIVDETIDEYNEVAALCSAGLPPIDLRQKDVSGYKST